MFSIVFILEINNSRNRVPHHLHSSTSTLGAHSIKASGYYTYTNTRTHTAHMCVFTSYGNISRCLDSYNDNDDDGDDNDDEDDDKNVILCSCWVHTCIDAYVHTIRENK